MFNKIKVNNFYNKLINNKKINKYYFDNINDDLKNSIITDERFVNYIDLELLLNNNGNNKQINENFIINLSDNKLKLLFNRISTHYMIKDIDLKNIYLFLKNKYIKTSDIELKETIAKLLFSTVKESFHSKEEYINEFINLFNEFEKIELFKLENMIKFITFHSKGTNAYYGYKNFFNNILNNVFNEEIKYNLMKEIFKYMIKHADVKRLYLECLINNLTNENIIRLLSIDEFIEEYKYIDNRTFNYQLLLDIIIPIKNYNIKKQIIKNYFTGFENINNLIINRNESGSDYLKLDGNTIKAFYELDILKDNVDNVIIESCKDELLFEVLEKYENKDEKLLEIPNDVDINLLLDFANKHNIEIFNETFAKKFSLNDEYFRFLPIEKLSLLINYIGDNNDMFFEKLSYSHNKENLLLKSFAKINIDKLIEFSKEYNIDIYKREFVERFKNYQRYFELLPIEKSYLIKFYNGQNLSIFFDKLKNVDNKLEILFNNNLIIYDDTILNESLKTDYFNDFDKKLITEVIKVKDVKLRETFKEFIISKYNDIPENKVEVISELLTKIRFSNSIEIINFRSEIAHQLLVTDNPLENLNKIENIFTKNNLPTVGKIYSIFEILHPDFDGFNFNTDSKVSPVLKNSSNRQKKVIVFSDLLKNALGSNNRSLKEYIYNLERGNELYKLITNKKINLSELDKENKVILETFIKHAMTLYNNTLVGKKNNQDLSNSLEENIILINKLYPDTLNLSDKIISMFCHFAGFDTLDEIKSYINKKIDDKNKRNENLVLSLDKGDLIKGIDGIEHLKNILQNGSVSKEFLGAYSSSDLTPLDTDLSIILEKKETLEETINNTSSKIYGDFWLVLKKDDRFRVTRTNVEENAIKSDKYELFYTGKTGLDHYGIRTGFASTDIDYIVSKNSDPKIGLEIAMNGFYIPVVNMKNELIFTKENYNNLRDKMSGLSYYDINNYNFSNNLNNEFINDIQEDIKNNREYLNQTKSILYKTFKESVETLNLSLKDFSDGDLTEGSVELIDTGSTGRETNVGKASDFDFILRIDNSILSDPNKLNTLKQCLTNSFINVIESTITNNGDFRYKGVTIDGLEKTIDLDITFTQKTNKINYSTDTALKDRLNTIKNIDKEKYDLVLSNIILAKKVLKSASVYKPNRGVDPEGGLGGVGIENWILQNGGSLIDAAKSFITASNNKTFEEFKQSYFVWDFGENYLSSEKNIYPHDNFINNMNDIGYEKMKIALKNFLSNAYEMHYEQNNIKL